MKVSPEMDADLAELLQVQTCDLNTLATARTLGVLHQCVTYNSECWQKFLAQAFWQGTDPELVERCLQCAAVNIRQVFRKFWMYQIDRQKLFASKEARHLRIVRSCEGEKDISWEILLSALRRRALTTCIRSICSDLLGIGNRGNKPLKDRLNDLEDCPDSTVHFEVLSDLASSLARGDRRGLIETKNVLKLLTMREEKEILRKEWDVLYCFARFVLEQLDIRSRARSKRLGALAHEQQSSVS